MFHAFHCNWILFRDGEASLLFGATIGRVSYEPDAKWLYSLRVALFVCSLEILWKSGAPDPETREHEIYD